MFSDILIYFIFKETLFLKKPNPGPQKLLLSNKSSHWEGGLTPDIHLPLGDTLLILLLQSHIKKAPFSSLNKHMSRFCKVGSGGRISLSEGPAGPHSLNICSPDVCLSLILLKESACFLTGLCWADEENGSPPPLASSDLPHPHPGFTYTTAQLLPSLWLERSQGGQREQSLQWCTACHPTSFLLSS